MNNNNYTLKLLNFQDKNINLIKVEFINNTYSKESWFFDQQVKPNNYGFTSYQSVIECCINNNRELEEAYILLQDLYKIARFSSYETARTDLLEWCEKVEKSELNFKEFKKTALTYRS